MEIPLKQSKITARLGGREVALEIRRDLLEKFGQMLGLPEQLYAQYTRLATGQWTIEDVRAPILAGFAGANGGWPIHHEATVDPVLRKNGHGHYVGLAARVIEAALFGVEPDAARWDEDAVLGVAA
jgi:hypothetical protein